MRLLLAFLLLPLPAFAADLPYSLDDIMTICYRHEHLEPVVDEQGSHTAAIRWNAGFEHCEDLKVWYALTLDQRTDEDAAAVAVMFKQFGPAPKQPEPTHVK